MAWKSRTNRGRVVYDRAPHQFSAADLRRVAEKITSRPAELQKTDDFNAFASALAEVLNNVSEYLVEQILEPFGLGVLADDVVDKINQVVENVRKLLGDYLANARGPLGAPPE